MRRDAIFPVKKQQFLNALGRVVRSPLGKFTRRDALLPKVLPGELPGAFSEQ
jgi:hypothetical protein